MENNRVEKWKTETANVLLIVAMMIALSLVGVTGRELTAGETITQWAWFDKMAVVAAGIILLVVFTLHANNRKIIDVADAISQALMIWGGIEAVWGLCQLFGVLPSGHARYAITGSFFNPGPYAGYLAMALPISLYHYLSYCGLEDMPLSPIDKIRKGMAAVTGLCMLCVLPATMSRTAWLAAGISCWLTYIIDRNWGVPLAVMWKHYKRHILIAVPVFLAVLVLALWLLFQLKPESARGRLFTWKITCLAIAESPVIGYDTFAEAYGEAQEAYFAQGDYEPWEERVAGTPKYAFNEYLRLLVEIGIPMFVCVLLFVILCLAFATRKNAYEVFIPVFSLLIFAFSSYPLYLPAFIATLVLLLATCLIRGIVDTHRRRWQMMAVVLLVFAGIRTWGYEDREVLKACRKEVNAQMLYRAGAYEAAAEEYEKIYPMLKKKGEFLFEYGHCLHKLGRYWSSEVVLIRAAMHSADPMIWNIRGKNHQATKLFGRAEEYYWKAAHRLPGRIYPYYLLAKLYAEWGKPEKFEAMREIVMTKKPKVESTAIQEMREELKKMKVEKQKPVE